MVIIQIDKKRTWKRNYTSLRPPSSWCIKPVDWTLVDELIDQGYFLKDIAKKFNISRPRFCQVFKKKHGMHFITYKHLRGIESRKENLEKLLRKKCNG